MIYDIKTKTIIVTPPKCGSTILHHVLCKMPNFWYILGPSKWDTTTKHCLSKSISTRELTIKRWILLLRNPYNRLISMWNHRVSYDNYDGSLSDFINHHNLASGWYAPATSYIEKIDGIIKQEDIFNDCSTLFEGDFSELKRERMNISVRKHKVDEDENVLLENAVNTIYLNDIQVGGYENKRS